ncbi:hypothetical protein H8958_007272 [Nasalis larvatus]
MLEQNSYLDPNQKKLAFTLQGKTVKSGHVIYAPSSHSKYSGESFPGISNALFDIESRVDPCKASREVKRKISVAAFTVQAASEALKQVAYEDSLENLY